MLKSKMEIRLTIGWLLLLRACLFSASPAIRATGIGNSNDGSSSESEEEHSSDSQILFPNPIYPIRSPEEDSPAEDGSLESESFERNDGVRNQSDGLLPNPIDPNESPDGHVPLAGGGSENSGQLPNESEDNKIADNNSLKSSDEIGGENGTEGGQGQDVIEEDQQPVEEGGIRVDLLAQKKHVGDIVQLWDESEIDGNMRNALKSTSNNRWTQLRDKDGKYVIPYVITGQFNQAQRQTILKGMDAIDQNTCIRFKARQTESDYVDIQNRKDEGCYTTVGRLRGRQVLMLESGWQRSCGRGCTETFPGCVNHGTVVHELMHKIGLWHEQMRFDRDKYIRINWQNIVPGFQSQFNKINEAQSTVFNLPYDFKSIMHYGKNSGARDRTLVTMQTHEARFQDVIGTAKDASTQDYQKICSIYQCARCMGRPFSPLRSLVYTFREQQSDANADVDTENEDNNSTAIGDEPNSSKCEPLNQDCDQGIQPGHSLYNLYCCPKCEQCEPRPFCSSVHPVEQKILYETFCCGRCI